MSRTGFGSVSIAATRSACLTPRAKNFRSGRCRRRGLILTTSMSTKTATPGPDRCSAIGSRGSIPSPAQLSNIFCLNRPTCAEYLSTTRRRRSRSGLAAITARRSSSWSLWISRERLQRGSVEFHRVTAQYGFLVRLREIIALQKLVDLVAALRRVEHFVREVAPEKKRLTSALGHRGI